VYSNLSVVTLGVGLMAIEPRLCTRRKCRLTEDRK
jgi:hypothetical protein